MNNVASLIGVFAKSGSDALVGMRIKLVGTIIHKIMSDKIMSETTTDSIFSPYVNTLSLDAKQRYTSKLLYDYGTKSLPDPYSLAEKWSTNPDSWPDLTFGDIYLYLIDTPSIYTKESMKAYKSLEAYRYVVSGHVQAVLSHYINESSPYIAMKAKVTPSQRARNKPHEPWVYLEKSSGAVFCAHCTCMAGLGEVCSHIGALLFKVEIAVKMGLTQTSSTSKACQWNNTFRKEVLPATITDIFDQIKGKRKVEVPSVQANGSATLPPSSVLEELYMLAPNAAFFTTVTTPTFEDVSHPVNNRVEKYPELLTNFQDSDIFDITEKCNNIFQSYKVSENQAENLEAITRNQAISTLWYQHRMGRVTGTKAHDVLTRRDTTIPDNLVKRIVGYVSYDLSKKEAVKWGIQHEDECRQAYSRHQTNQHINFKTELSGFVINSQHPFLGATPDGIISCDCCGKGTLEIKCPFKHRDKTVQQAVTTDKDFCLDASLHLKHKHRYYTQIQLQMFLTKCQYCDFVVYTKNGNSSPSMAIVRVPIDIDFCNHLVTKCEQFIKDYVIVELVTRQLENLPISLATTSLENKENDTRTTWCLCSEPEYGRMIKCENEDCPYQWFHYKCVNIRRKPKGKWYCVSCDE